MLGTQTLKAKRRADVLHDSKQPKIIIRMNIFLRAKRETYMQTRVRRVCMFGVSLFLFGSDLYLCIYVFDRDYVHALKNQAQ